MSAPLADVFSSRLLEIFLTGLLAVVASSGFWSYAVKAKDNRELTRKLLIGLAHDKISYLCLHYIQRGYITHDEHENLINYLYEPYVAIGGNGSVARLMAELNKLPFYHFDEKKEKQYESQ